VESIEKLDRMESIEKLTKLPPTKMKEQFAGELQAMRQKRIAGKLQAWEQKKRSHFEQLQHVAIESWDALDRFLVESEGWVLCDLGSHWSRAKRHKAAIAGFKHLAR